MPYLPAVEVEPTSPATATVIWLHGLGADGHDFEPIVPELCLPPELAIRFIFPHAPAIPVTINGGYVMPAWYDILAMDIDRKVDVTHLEASAHEIGKLIEHEIARGIPSERIVIAGFSQGGAVGYQVALAYPKPLAGLLAMSTYFATADTIQPNAANAHLPIHIFHGTQDSVVPEILGIKAYQTLKTRGYQPAYSEYQMEHNVCAEEIAEIAQCLQTWLAAA
ncbi:MAG: carboxylesterase [Gammaproteobacteria bacterium]|nr:carboxylesterase [Gammaproteobacteria bacterium]MBU1722564.1 carboxylesterase [Gammaproteobacteria bacterium]MBU2004465.1 carboxylesterase [Gammaproteobacteria bacterium]